MQEISSSVMSHKKFCETLCTHSFKQHTVHTVTMQQWLSNNLDEFLGVRKTYISDWVLSSLQHKGIEKDLTLSYRLSPIQSNWFCIIIYYVIIFFVVFCFNYYTVYINCYCKKSVMKGCLVLRELRLGVSQGVCDS